MRLFRTANFIFASFLLTLLLSCNTQSDQLRVESANFDQQIDPVQNLEFNFNHDIAPDSIIGQWSQEKYLRFNPEIAGRFMWNSHHQLVFSPASSFKPNTDYTAALLPDLLKFTGNKYRLSDKQLTFHTPYLNIISSRAFWALDPDHMEIVQIRVNIQFSNVVNITTLKKDVEIAMNNKPVDFTLLTPANGTEMEFSLPESDKKIRNGIIRITLHKGMKVPGSDRALPEDITMEIEVPARNEMTISEITTEFEEGEGAIYVFTSQPVKQAQSLKSMITTEPATPFEISYLSSGFKLKGEFAEDQIYQLTVSGKLQGIFGPSLGEDYLQTVNFGAMKPFIAFSEDNAMYLTPKGKSNIALKIINISKIKITVFKVYDNNIQHFLRNGKNWDWYEQDGDYYENYNYSLSEDYGNIISTLTIETRSLQRSGTDKLLHLNADELQLSSSRKGLYAIKVEAVDKQWLNDVQLVAASDIGLIAHKGTDEIFVAVRSIATAKPLNNVRVKFISSSNQQVYETTTNSDGIARFSNMKTNAPGFTVSLITAHLDNDYNALIFNQSKVETSRFDVGGKYTAGLNYDVYLYGDRNLFRPGDTVNCNALMRSFNWEIPGEIPIKFRVISPDGRDFLKRRATLNGYGAAAFSFPVPVTALTGTYIIEVQSATDVLLSSWRISVEEFMPDRIKVEVKTNKPIYAEGEMLETEIEATNLFGPPASGRKVESELRISRANFNHPRFEAYNFSITTPGEITFDQQIMEGTTGADGKLKQVFQLPSFSNIGLLNARLFTTVFDETGRPVNRYTEAKINTQSAFIGIKEIPTWLSQRRPIGIQLVSLNSEGKALETKARVEVVRIDYQTVMEKKYGQVQYVSQRKETSVFSRLVTIKANGFALDYTPPNDGSYEIRVSLTDSKNYVKQNFYAYYGESGSFASYNINREGEIGIEMDKSQYVPGETARILFKTPFEGELLITLERDKVMEYFTMQAGSAGATLNLKIKEEYLPNIYVSATLIRNINNTSLPLTVAHGYANIGFNDPNRKMPLSITASAESRSKVAQTITIKTEPGAEVTIAVVDEGILQVKGYNSPDPYEWFFKKRALEVEAFDLFDALFPELGAPSSTGGDRGFDMGKRLNPLAGKRIKLLSFWSGPLKADAAGMVKYTVRIPEFSGTARIMAVSYSKNKYGGASKSMTIADPVVISTSLPRFLSPGDKVEVMATFTNTTKQPITAEAKSLVSGPLATTQPSNGKIKLPAGKELQLPFILTASKQTGMAKLTLQVTAGSEKFTWTAEVPVRPANLPQMVTKGGIIRDNEQLTFSSAAELMPGTIETEGLLTSNPMGEYAQNLSELINYPYGCLEQVISKAFPQLYYEDLSKLLKQKSSPLKLDPTANVQEALRKIASLQQYNGGLVMWPSGGDISWWNTAYAGHFFYEADKAGYTINKTVSENISRYLTTMVKQKPTTAYFFMEDDRWQTRNFPQREIFYSLYVLALHGKQHIPTMNYYKARLDDLTADSRFMLASAYYLIGDANSAQKISRHETKSDGEAQRMTGGSYSSPIRDHAISLYTLISANPDDPKIPLLAKQLSEMVNRGKWMSTQENVFTLLAFGKMSARITPGNVTVAVTADNKPLAEFKGKDTNFKTRSTDLKLTAKGKGSLYYLIQSEGIPKSGLNRQEDQILRVRRQLLTRDGQPVNTNNIKTNDLLVVKITLNTTDNSLIDNIIVTDLLPACFEAENTRLTTERDLNWAKEQSQPDHLDFRDDRVNIFASIKSTGPLHFYYMVRVINPGDFTWGSVGAIAMYNGFYYSYADHTTLKVK